MTNTEIEIIGYLLFGLFFVLLPLALLGFLYVAVMEFIDTIRE
jgi:hypothetical protein